MKQINEKLNKIARAIDETVELPETNLITDSLDAITKALGGTPNDSNLIVDKLDDIAGVAEPKPTGNIELTENGENINVAAYATATVNVPQPSGNIEITENGENINIAQYATATVNVSGGGGDEPIVYIPEQTVTVEQMEGMGYMAELSDVTLDPNNPLEILPLTVEHGGSSGTFELTYNTELFPGVEGYMHDTSPQLAVFYAQNKWFFLCADEGEWVVSSIEGGTATINIPVCHLTLINSNSSLITVDNALDLAITPAQFGEDFYVLNQGGQPILPHNSRNLDLLYQIDPSNAPNVICFKTRGVGENMVNCKVEQSGGEYIYSPIDPTNDCSLTIGFGGDV